MTASYRLIHFAPDPFTGTRFPLGAIVAEDGQVRIARVGQLPLAESLGSTSLAVAVQRLYARLDDIRSPHALPLVFGPYATLAAPQAVPEGVEDAHAWVQRLLSPEPPGEQVVAPSRPQRGSMGYRFFETWKVARYVRKRFQPSQDRGGWLREHAASLRPITHWVKGRSRVLLMEPVLPRREQFEQDLKDIAAKFGAYRCVLSDMDEPRQGKLIAYVTAGGSSDQRSHARATLAPYAHRVIDTLNDGDRAAFVGRIRQLGAEGEAQQELGGEE